jgi:hypothetical protein
VLRDVPEQILIDRLLVPLRRIDKFGKYGVAHVQTNTGLYVGSEVVQHDVHGQ